MASPPPATAIHNAVDAAEVIKFWHGIVAEHLRCDNNDTISQATIRSAFVVSHVICGLSTISLGLGTAIAYLASGYPRYQAAMATVAGFLLIGGLGMLGYALEAGLGHP